jgi:diphthamide synthase (EF-2-diphthine--ammonia ligase)
LNKNTLKTKPYLTGVAVKTLLALYKVLQDPFEINCLLTSVNQEFQRVSMHGVRVELLENQAKASDYH